MWVLLIYVVLMIAGDVLDVGIGAVASNMWGDPISLPIFLACYFVTLALAWVVAVKIAESTEADDLSCGSAFARDRALVPAAQHEMREP